MMLLHGWAMTDGFMNECLPGAQGWICNSSICMTRRGLKPTGIAIYEAQEKGFASVAHFVQVRGLCSVRGAGQWLHSRPDAILEHRAFWESVRQECISTNMLVPGLCPAIWVAGS
jgi:hypothetical protein